ncbi:hypothetical protein BDY17DRAFT_157749 [Neohortaea acidophila]|uniref:Uncharacterized protein n=1 Tax=Neohortaea acidophila TaxID=245834 RepID=A0A6A6PQF2_9PEZI|nr:uncharacterized protein BDY17DRAFT_157749 [Neohortaea acidophila]KAF2482299.1 hypothetical protein BDY17DRAFT_157749 [Neohortaea acidophila]
MSKSSNERLLFIECNGATGRPSRTVRPLLSRHVMGGHVTTNSYHSGEIIFEDEKPAIKAPSVFGAARRTRTAHRKGNSPKPPRDGAVVNKQHLPIHTAFLFQSGHAEACAPLIKSLNSFQRQEEVAKWWFYCGDEPSPAFEVAQYHWATAAWDIARQSNFFLEILKLYAWRKRAQLTGHADHYVAQQVSLIRRIKDSVDEHGEHLESEPLVLVAVGVLAYVALLEGDMETSATHLHALRAFDLARHFEHSKQGWLYMVWVDLRFSLIQARPPVLDHFIPSAYRHQLPRLCSEEELKMLHERASRKSALVPCSALFDEVEMHCVFLKLHHLYHAWSPAQEMQYPLYGLLYDLEYRLRVLHAGMRQYDRELATTTDTEAVRLNNYAELILLAIQLHVWIISRHWAPVSSHSRQAVLNRACELIAQASAEDLVATWKGAADVRSLVWCLATVVAFFLETSVDGAVIQTLQRTLASVGVFTREELSGLLKEWFWHEDWHPRKLELVWSAIEEPNTQKPRAGFDLSRKQKTSFYIGAVEFYQ